jgi:hypothetical protein
VDSLHPKRSCGAPPKNKKKCVGCDQSYKYGTPPGFKPLDWLWKIARRPNNAGTLAPDFGFLSVRDLRPSDFITLPLEQ